MKLRISLPDGWEDMDISFIYPTDEADVELTGVIETISGGNMYETELERLGLYALLVYETPEEEPEPSAEPTPEPSAEPTPEPTPEPSAEPTPEPAPNDPDDIPPTGDRILPLVFLTGLSLSAAGVAGYAVYSVRKR